MIDILTSIKCVHCCLDKEKEQYKERARRYVLREYKCSKMVNATVNRNTFKSHHYNMTLTKKTAHDTHRKHVTNIK